jgi:hypothetical protein
MGKAEPRSARVCREHLRGENLKGQGAEGRQNRRAPVARPEWSSVPIRARAKFTMDVSRMIIKKPRQSRPQVSSSQKMSLSAASPARWRPRSTTSATPQRVMTIRPK